jgi:hypothetical protein
MKLTFSLFFLLIMSSQLVMASKGIEGLIDRQCMSCHGNEVYTRSDRKVKNLVQLEKQLHRCNHVIGEKMDIDTVTQLTDYLNNKYYKF